MIITIKLINLSITSHSIMWEEEKYFFHPLMFWWPWKNRKIWDTLLILETTNEILGQQVKAGKKVRILSMPAFCSSICSVWLRKEDRTLKKKERERGKGRQEFFFVCFSSKCRLIGENICVDHFFWVWAALIIYYQSNSLPRENINFFLSLSFVLFVIMKRIIR